MSEEAGTCQDASQMQTPRLSKQVLQEAFGLLAAEQLHWLGGVFAAASPMQWMEEDLSQHI